MQYAVPLVVPAEVRSRLDELSVVSDLALIDAWLDLIRTWAKPPEFAGSIAILIGKFEQSSALNDRRKAVLLDCIGTLVLPDAARQESK